MILGNPLHNIWGQGPISSRYSTAKHIGFTEKKKNIFFVSFYEALYYEFYLFLADKNFSFIILESILEATAVLPSWTNSCVDFFKNENCEKVELNGWLAAFSSVWTKELSGCIAPCCVLILFPEKMEPRNLNRKKYIYIANDREMKIECADYTKNYHACISICIEYHVQQINLFEFPCSAYSFGFFT